MKSPGKTESISKKYNSAAVCSARSEARIPFFDGTSLEGRFLWILPYLDLSLGVDTLSDRLSE